jgi:hypothetical protein
MIRLKVRASKRLFRPDFDGRIGERRWHTTCKQTRLMAIMAGLARFGSSAPIPRAA